MEVQKINVVLQSSCDYCQNIIMGGYIENMTNEITFILNNKPLENHVRWDLIRLLHTENETVSRKVFYYVDNHPIVDCAILHELSKITLHSICFTDWMKVAITKGLFNSTSFLSSLIQKFRQYGGAYENRLLDLVEDIPLTNGRFDIRCDVLDENDYYTFKVLVKKMILLYKRILNKDIKIYMDLYMAEYYTSPTGNQDDIYFTITDGIHFPNYADIVLRIPIPKKEDASYNIKSKFIEKLCKDIIKSTASSVILVGELYYSDKMNPCMKDLYVTLHRHKSFFQ